MGMREGYGDKEKKGGKEWDGVKEGMGGEGMGKEEWGGDEVDGDKRRNGIRLVMVRDEGDRKDGRKDE